MATVQQGIREALTFDDVLLKPGLSDVMPGEVDIRSRVIPGRAPWRGPGIDRAPETAARRIPGSRLRRAGE